MNLVTITYAFKYAILAGINQGVILTLNSLTALYNVLIFRVFFNERVSIVQLSGMLIMIACVVLIGVSTSVTEAEDTLDGENKQSYAILAISFSFLSPLFLSLKHIFIRSYKQQYNSWDMAIDGLIFEYQLYIFVSIYFIYTSTFDFFDFQLGTIASLFMMTGKILISLAVSNGLAGPAASLINT